MCSNPQNHDGLTFACRVCNDCITARKNDWVARAMAELATSAEAYAITLTYRNDVEGNAPDGAKVFNYKHVQEFLKRLREQYARDNERRADIRYIVAGEQGSKKGRVHWHMVLFTDQPLTQTGEWADANGEEIPGVVYDRRVNWSFWDHGNVYFQKPDQGAMAYVLKYCLKDQFNMVKSKGTMRFTKSEQHSASYFRMSKTPSIGMRWLQDQCNRWDERNSVPPSLNLKVPGYSGFWWPKAGLRDYLLQRLHEINKRIKAETGRDAPQWNTLLGSVGEVEKDFEALLYGDLKQNEEEFNVEAWQEKFKREQEARARAQAIAAAGPRAGCDCLYICSTCYEGQTPERRTEFKDWVEGQKQVFREAENRKGGVHSWYGRKNEFNPFCLSRGQDIIKKAFGAG